MSTPTLGTRAGRAGALGTYVWPNPDARWTAVLVHGYGEHLGRYQEVADALRGAGATVLGNDHVGHGRSDGERALVTDFETVVDDLRDTVASATGPVVLVGQAVGGTVAARYVQRHPAGVAALVLAAPVLGTSAALDLLELDPIPAEPTDPAALSRDPAVGAAYAADPLVWHGGFARATLEALETVLSTIAFDHPLGDELPLLWLHGTEDALVPVAETRAGLDQLRGLNCTEILYPGARHELFHETNAAEVLADLTAFVTRALG